MHCTAGLRYHSAAMSFRISQNHPDRAPSLGLGGGALGVLDDAAAFRLLDCAASLGIQLIDVARSYGDAERRVGHWLKAKPRDVVVVTKGGYVDDEAWTGAAVARSIADSRARLQVDQLDVFLMHSCAPQVLDRDDVKDALTQALARDVARIGYAGDNDFLHGAIDWSIGRTSALGFTVFEQSLSLLDGKARVHTLPRARAVGHVIAKRALANAPWATAKGTTDGPDVLRQRERFGRARLPDVGLPLDELFLRYAAYTDGVDVTLVGTSSTQKLERAVLAFEKGPLGADIHTALADALARCDDDAVT